MLVKSFEGPDEDPAILQDAPHPVVDVLQHLAALAHRLKGAGISEAQLFCTLTLLALPSLLSQTNFSTFFSCLPAFTENLPITQLQPS